MLPTVTTYEDLRAQFRWTIPASYNIAFDACDRWADVEPERTALLHVLGSGDVEAWSYGQLKVNSCKLANALHSLGVVARDRVALLLPQARKRLFHILRFIGLARSLSRWRLCLALKRCNTGWRMLVRRW